MGFKRRERIEVDPRGKVHLSVDQLPEVDRALKCARPVLHVVPGLEQYPGIEASCFLVRYKGRLIAVTAWHVVKDMALPRAVAIPRRLGGPIEYINFALAVGPKNVRTTDRKTGTDEEDVALFLAEDDLDVGGDAIDLDSTELADIDKCCPGESILATHGYPKDGQKIEYPEEDGQVGNTKTLATIMPGIYEGKLHGRVHTMACDLSEYSDNEWRRPAGVSGSPVVLCAPEGDPFDGGSWKAGLVGMVVRGGSTRLHFIDTLTVLAHVRKFERMIAEEERREGATPV
jgi:hypothetical protein